MALYALGDSVPQTPGEGEYWVAPDAQVMGQVELRRNASVWYGAVVRGSRSANQRQQTDKEQEETEIATSAPIINHHDASDVGVVRCGRRARS